MKIIQAIMIDDNQTKQDWFLEIVKLANKKAADRGMAVQLRAGFDPPEEFGLDPPDRPDTLDQNGAWKLPSRLSLRPEALIRAITTDEAVYLVDLQLLPKPDVKSALLARQDDPSAQAALEEITAIERRNGRSWTVVDRHLPCALILAYLKHASKPYLFVSTDAAGGDAQTMVSLNLADRVSSAFPNFEMASYSESDKTEKLEEFSDLLLGLIDPWKRIKLLTRSWFRENIGVGWRSYAEDGLPHNLPAQAAERGRIEDAQNACIASVFPWLVMAKGSHDPLAFHECLKTVVGTPAQWMGDVADKPLSLAGAYLVLLVALNQTARPYVSESFVVQDWSCFLRPGGAYASDCLPFMRHQDKSNAEKTLRSLYEFFRQVIYRKDGALGISNFKPPTRNRPFFSVKLTWEPEDIGKFAACVRYMASDFLNNRTGDSGEERFPRSKVSGALLRFTIASQIASDGFGPPGGVWLDAKPSEPNFGRLCVGTFAEVQ